MELKKHVVKGMAWTFAEKALTAVFQMFVGLVLMNFLFPDDYGTIQTRCQVARIDRTLIDDVTPQLVAVGGQLLRREFFQLPR